jgi:hypothetical protein
MKRNQKLLKEDAICPDPGWQIPPRPSIAIGNSGWYSPFTFPEEYPSSGIAHSADLIKAWGEGQGENGPSRYGGSRRPHRLISGEKSLCKNRDRGLKFHSRKKLIGILRTKYNRIAFTE